MTQEIILASASPRRALLLGMLGVQFRTHVSAVSENFDTQLSAHDQARLLALAKARAVGQGYPGRTVLAADTLISFRGSLLGKPASPDEALAMLRSLRGEWHRVLTGVAVVAADGAEHVGVETTRVLMRRYSDEEIAAYVASGDPMDKAAAYAIQNREFHPVARLQVCYTNVMGLPLCLAQTLLERAGLPAFVAGNRLRSRSCSFCRRAREG